MKKGLNPKKQLKSKQKVSKLNEPEFVVWGRQDTTRHRLYRQFQ